MQEVFVKNSSANCVKKGRHPKTDRWSDVIKMKDNKLNEDNDNIVGYRLYLEGIERKKRLALLKKEYYKPKLPLETVFERRRIDTNSSERDSNSIEHLRQLYVLSKLSQEDGKNEETILRKLVQK